MGEMDTQDNDGRDRTIRVLKGLGYDFRKEGDIDMITVNVEGHKNCDVGSVFETTGKVYIIPYEHGVMLPILNAKVRLREDLEEAQIHYSVPSTDSVREILLKNLCQSRNEVYGIEKTLARL